ncbi:2-dehydropantoate 2-reductase [Sulfitobacter sp. HNIBRBA3233]|uniref:2-dehydropantoate 2-reductase n=1 Tax=Sulfitobacter marinivivus TaxID=3158558 RepID=UPI0032DE9D50
MGAERKRPAIAIVGAGAIGGFVGGMLAEGGRTVRFLARCPTLDSLRDRGLHLTDYGGLDLRLTPDRLTACATPAEAFRGADVILVCVKTAATAAVAAEIAAHAPPQATVVSLQNGLAGLRQLRDGLPDREVLAGMVPFNVVGDAAGHRHRATSGTIQIGPDGREIARHLTVAGMPVECTPEIEAVQYGKLLINLNNALNALSGLTLHRQLLDREWRRLMADQMREALRVLRAHGIRARATTPLPPGAVPFVLRLPTPLFRLIAAQMLTIDPSARSSMAQDIAAGKKTEIDALQGEIIALGAEKSVPTPLACAIRDAVLRAEREGCPHSAPQDLRP